MWQGISEFFDSQYFMPHGHCFLWQPAILWMHVISDAVIAVSYYSIPFALLYFSRKRPDMPFRLLFALFSLFILLCGTTHFISIWVLWFPDYGPEGLVKMLTAITSFGTAVLIWKLMPQLLTVPSPLQLQTLNEELTHTNEAVELKVRSRTVELAEANYKLEEAYSLADKASKAKSEFLANMSHEIRTPMNAVIGLSNILSMSKPLSEKQQEYISTLKFSAESLLALITDLLDISKIESEIVALDNVTFNLHQLVTEVTRIMSVRADEKKINLTLNFDEKLTGEFVGDSTRIRQILLNLMSNAVKFTEQGSVSIHVLEKKSKDAGVRAAIISVVDTGIGIPSDKQESIFNKFSQADNTINRKYGGTGLGLAISKSLVELMGGSVNVSSELGKGSTFILTLPLARPTDIKTLLSKQPASSKDNDSSAGKKTRNILLVEDYQPNILVATTMLNHLGYHYEVAVNGQEAIDRIFSHSFDLVLMDVQMPILDGYTTTRQIREREIEAGLKAIPIIGITAYAMAGDREKCLVSGMDDYISKPFNMDDLKEKMQRLITLNE